MSVWFAVGCGHQEKDKTPTDSSQINYEGVRSIDSENGMSVIAIMDCGRTMKKDLFRGSNDRLLDSLVEMDELPAAINAFLAVGNGHMVLFDAGLGGNAGGHLFEKLKALGIDPSDIDAVCLTHLHPDHIGGLLRDGQPVFPRAAIYLSVDEFNAWSDDGVFAERNELWKNVLSVYALNVKPFVDGDTLLDGSVVAHLFPGHTPGHTVYTVGNTLIVGDILHSQDLQIDHPDFCAAYDNNKPQATASRKKLLYKARTDQLTIAGSHMHTQMLQL